MFRATVKFLLCAVAFGFFPCGAVAHVFHDCREYVKFGAPGESGDLLCRHGFAIAHNPQRKTPDWVAERLTREMVLKNTPHAGSFRPDPELKPGYRAELADYRDSGYVPRQLVAARNMRGNARSVRDSFLLSNTVPHAGMSTNGGAWKHIEESVRTWATQRGELYVFTGPVYAVRQSGASIGSGKIFVPEAFFKVVYDPVRVEAIAFLVPNRPVVRGNLYEHVTTVYDIESRTGLNFFEAIRPDVRQLVKSKKAEEVWR